MKDFATINTSNYWDSEEAVQKSREIAKKAIEEVFGKQMDGPKTHDTTEICIKIRLRNCRACPFHSTERTEGAEHALDFFCTKVNDKKICGYIEWDSDMGPVPEWCPYRTDREKKKEIDKETRRFIQIMKEDNDDV